MLAAFSASPGLQTPTRPRASSKAVGASSINADTRAGISARLVPARAAPRRVWAGEVWRRRGEVRRARCTQSATRRSRPPSWRTVARRSTERVCELHAALERTANERDQARAERDHLRPERQQVGPPRTAPGRACRTRWAGSGTVPRPKASCGCRSPSVLSRRCNGAPDGERRFRTAQAGDRGRPRPQASRPTCPANRRYSHPHPGRVGRLRPLRGVHRDSQGRVLGRGQGAGGHLRGAGRSP